MFEWMDEFAREAGKIQRIQKPGPYSSSSPTPIPELSVKVHMPGTKQETIQTVHLNVKIQLGIQKRDTALGWKSQKASWEEETAGQLGLAGREDL